MISTTINHLEQFNKTFNVQRFLDVVVKENDIDNYNSDQVLKTILKGMYEANDELKKRKPFVDIDETYETSFKNNVKEKGELVRMYFFCYIIDEWLDYKQIYKFDVDTLKMLFEQNTLNYTYDEIKALKMPYDCFIIENDLNTGDKIADSMIIRRKARGDGSIVLSFYGFLKDTKAALFSRDVIIKENQTLKETLDNDKSVDESDKRFVNHIMSLILYLCQPKVEIFKKRVERTKKENKNIKHFYGINYTENECGFKLGAAIRNYKYIYEKNEEGTSKRIRTVKPHIRCGHFHHYWTGKGRKELTVKFIEPTFILGGNKLPTMHEVK